MVDAVDHSVQPGVGQRRLHGSGRRTQHRTPRHVLVGAHHTMALTAHTQTRIGQGRNGGRQRSGGRGHGRNRHRVHPGTGSSHGREQDANHAFPRRHFVNGRRDRHRWRYGLTLGGHGLGGALGNMAVVVAVARSCFSRLQCRPRRGGGSGSRGGGGRREGHAVLFQSRHVLAHAAHDQHPHVGPPAAGSQHAATHTRATSSSGCPSSPSSRGGGGGGSRYVGTRRPREECGAKHGQGRRHRRRSPWLVILISVGGGRWFDGRPTQIPRTSQCRYPGARSTHVGSLLPRRSGIVCAGVLPQPGGGGARVLRKHLATRCRTACRTRICPSSSSSSSCSSSCS